MSLPLPLPLPRGGENTDPDRLGSCHQRENDPRKLVAAMIPTKRRAEIGFNSRIAVKRDKEFKLQDGEIMRTK